MNLHQETRGDITILRPVGRLDSATSPELERVVLERIEAGCTRLVFDLSDMDYVSSAGLRVILLAGKKLRAAQGRLALSGMRDMVRDVFEMSGFLKLFVVTPGIDTALASV
ncbi:STAS domain-containing protein [Ramlibacter sp. MAHUQ-53]|uniref:STAS domain-containing protein n=1 Tax=unclassified Ramlibacter TaxID=2617605 RepID=UPI00362BEE4C